jgi:hypothetical protein
VIPLHTRTATRRPPFGPLSGVVITIVAVLALAAGGFWLWSVLTSRGGADSPAAALQLLATDLGTVITTQLVRLEIVEPGADLGIGSFEINDLKIDEAAAEQVRDNVVINTSG